MTAAPAFRKLLAGVSQDEKIAPLLQAALWSPDFKSFTVKVEGFKDRKPDGWFHPSTHPLWTEPALWLYRTQFGSLVREPFDPTSTLAVTAGTFFHDVIQTVLLQEGVLLTFDCPCGRKHSKAEIELVDEDTHTRGHTDGVYFEGDGFEFKTMNTMKMSRIPRGGPDHPDVIDWFKTKTPGYYAQAQEYLRLGERDRMIVVILSLTYPFEMREIHIPADRAFQFATKDKYRRVIQAAADHRPPRCQCTVEQMTGCPARGWCDSALDMAGEGYRDY